MPFFGFALVMLVAASCAVLALAGGDNPFAYFDEGSVGTWLNALQLIGCGFICWQIYRLRLRTDESKSFRLWLVGVVLSLYLAFDELIGLHEHEGVYLTFVRKTLNIPLRDSLIVGGAKLGHYSDLILLGYGLVVVLVCVGYRQELRRCRSSLPWFFAGMTLLACSLVIDTNILRTVIPAFDLHSPNIHRLEAWEESLKLTGFSAILAGLVEVYRRTRMSVPSQPA